MLSFVCLFSSCWCFLIVKSVGFLHIRIGRVPVYRVWDPASEAEGDPEPEGCCFTPGSSTAAAEGPADVCHHDQAQEDAVELHLSTANGSGSKQTAKSAAQSAIVSFDNNISISSKNPNVILYISILDCQSSNDFLSFSITFRLSWSDLEI